MQPDELSLFLEGTSTHAYHMLGCRAQGGKHRFGVWAPGALRVGVVGDGNGWQSAPMRRLRGGVWVAELSGFENGMCYKFEITQPSGETALKADPYAVCAEKRPKTASVVCELGGYRWGDEAWMRSRAAPYRAPMSIYEAHIGSWKQGMTYRSLAEQLIPYVKSMGYTHIELMPVAHHPHKASWGYQVTGYYAVDAEYGAPHELMAFIDACHQSGIGVILDWVSAHFPDDDFALARFDGAPLYEHPDPVRARMPEWGTLMFNYERAEVCSFMLSNALFWMRHYHADGLRADAVSALLYLDYGRAEGEWLKNREGGRENLAGVAFCRRLSRAFFAEYPQGVLIAEDSSAFPMVTRPVHDGGLGFNFKWNMGWMNDILSYMQRDFIFRKYHHDQLTHHSSYAFCENFILPFSHDEVVHSKKSMLDKMFGDDWQKFASLRLLLGYMFAYPGKKLMFMGSEFGQRAEWRHDEPLHWHLLEQEDHRKLQTALKALFSLYRANGALHEADDSEAGFTWLNTTDEAQSVVAFARHGRMENKNCETLVCLFNFTPAVYETYRVGVKNAGLYQEVFNSDQASFGGSGVTNERFIASRLAPWNGFADSIELRLPPLAAVYCQLIPCASNSASA